uniref:Uncharacterized protein n=1 Tax=Pseudo-nitzschia australis TaxID=44445 RepID=A0A6U9XI97_9STRA|mmetsp:Transcript_8054/g.17341  ORF Transcript_8054/g.17341 Transcript_8054/m.17341 type:complete len:242 (+) Transcript_8054:163-888(+)|eukprot:CAMPEP_0168192762 /NCGR_PEP_ID=MMETSP0139_2-20121125/18224_1 /TAXON_ID=44445 /ORGANISM="Pseudo-nitzschia australis, Strain 10249 10 AB" /LENGTH=241 /DNA_ID=CAMNT_0008116029 /DNA_START=64 /DNA_END=789 /DNA_ORIENTATION=-
MTTVAKAIPATCKVVAPATLKANSTFEATVDGITFMVTVPEAGVDEGETFEVPYPKGAATAFSAPTGTFRSGLCSCFSSCCCPFMMGWCCAPVVLGQVLERLNFGWGGCPRVNADGSRDTRPSPPICMVFLIATVVMVIIGASTSGAGTSTENSYAYIGSIVGGIWAWYLFIVATCARINMRKKFDIEPECCGNGCGDCLTVWLCSCCNVIQMITHTHDPKEYEYSCSSRTGLNPGDPVIV